jgi:hypothetical protein
MGHSELLCKLLLTDSILEAVNLKSTDQLIHIESIYNTI